MHSLLDFEKSQLRTDIPAFKTGDTVRVYCKIKEGDKERIQLFEGVVIAQHRGGLRASFTVRKVSYGIGVERIFPMHAPFIDRVELGSVGKVRRAKLYYLRHLSGKKARIFAKDTRGIAAAVAIPPEAPTEPTPPESTPA